MAHPIMSHLANRLSWPACAALLATLPAPVVAQTPPAAGVDETQAAQAAPGGDEPSAEESPAPRGDAGDAVGAAGIPDGTADQGAGAEGAGDADAGEDGFEEPPPFEPHRIDPALLAVGRRRGRQVYLHYCASCHGRRGDGAGPAARFLSLRPRDFTLGVYKWRTTPSGELPTDADLLRTVRRGAPGTPMPAWEGRLSMRDLWSVVQYIKTFSAFFEEDGAPQPLPMPGDVPTFDDAARQRGRLLYVLLKCWTCHGMSGTGDGPAAGDMQNDDGSRAVPYDFTQANIRSGNRPIDIYRTFTTGVNGTPMPSFDEAILVGRDGFEDLSSVAPALSSEGMARLRAYVATLPTSEEIWALPEAQRLRAGARRRWDLVAYVQSLSGGSVLWRYLWSSPYPN